MDDLICVRHARDAIETDYPNGITRSDFLPVPARVVFQGESLCWHCFSYIIRSGLVVRADQKAGQRPHVVDVVGAIGHPPWVSNPAPRDT